jgi:hypothetical protein
MPYLAALGIQPDQVRAQHTFSLRLGRNMILNERRDGVGTGRLDFLVVNADETPLFVVELKRPDEELSDDDRDQGISYARLVHPIAPLVLVTNTRESRLYDTITREPLSSADSATLIRSGGRLSADEDLHVRAEALEHFIGYSRENVATFSRKQRESRMRGLRGGDGLRARRYEPDLYVRREAVRGDISAFLASSKPVFALGGRSGFGKTNEMCAMAEELGNSHVVLFFNGTELSSSFSSALTGEFNWFFSQDLALAQICRRLANLADRSGRPVLIFIDAVDEAGAADLPQELGELVSHLDEFGWRIRLVISAKPEEWGRFAETRGVPSPLQDRLFRPTRSAVAIPASGDAASPVQPPLMSAMVGSFDSGERDTAVAAYGTAFGLGGPWPQAVRELARDPFMLRLIAEVASATGTIPGDPGERELVRRYVDEKLRRTSQPDRARLELVAVARALAASGRSHEEWEDDHVRRFPRAAESAPPSVPEAAVRSEAGLDATASVADELVAFGVLIRSRDRDGRASLAFAYDRVRDYMIATHVYDFEGLGTEEFRDATLVALASGPGASALRWYLPLATDGQWDGFIEAANRQVERLVSAYEAIRAHLAPELRSAVEPKGVGAVGAVFTELPGRRFFELALFRRESGALPRVCYDRTTFATWRDPRAEGAIPKRLLSSSRAREGFWFLRDPERYAAEHLLAELVKAVKDGRLPEQVDEYLLAERVVALAQDRRKQLGLPARPNGGVTLFGDDFVALELFPLDLLDLRRRIQIELAVGSYQQEHMSERLMAVRRAHEAAGRLPDFITATSEWTDADLRAWRERAVQAVDAGSDFTQADSGDGELSVFGVAVNALLRHRTRLERPLLPPPDLRNPSAFAGMRNFEEGYTDAQLARLMETIFGRARTAFDRVIEAAFSEPLRSMLKVPPTVPAVLCHRRALSQPNNLQFRAVIDYGAGSPMEGGTRPAGGALCAVVYSGGPTRLERSGTDWLDMIVTADSGSFRMRLHTQTGLVNIVSPYDAPPFVRGGSNSSSGRAPVRALMYSYVSQALRPLSTEALVTLLRTPHVAPFQAAATEPTATRPTQPGG